MKDLTVLILTHNRGNLLLETIKSVLNQDCNDFIFVISDNSSNDETYELLRNMCFLDKVQYRKRNVEYNSFDHFNLCISEITTKYFIMFHDDDIMLPNMISTLYSRIEKDSYVAVASNAFYLKNCDYTHKKFLNLRSESEELNDSDLVMKYSIGEIAPFPSYMYNKQLIGNNIFINNAGKYSDVTWLLRISKDYNLLWLNEPLMYYRIHRNQDSQEYDFFNQLKLIKIFSKSCNNRNIILKYRIGNLYIYETKKKRKIRCLSIYMKYSFFNLFPRIIIKKLLKKVS